MSKPVRRSIWLTIFVTLLILAGGPAVSHAAMDISAGYYHTLALKEDGTVLAWGQNNNGQLGDGTNEDRHEPVQVTGLSEIAAIAAGVNHNAVLKADGSVWCWGRNSWGELGNNIYQPSNMPVAVADLSDVIDVAVGYAHSLALKADGTLWAWGGNWYGQLGIGSTRSAT